MCELTVRQQFYSIVYASWLMVRALNRARMRGTRLVHARACVRACVRAQRTSKHVVPWLAAAARVALGATRLVRDPPCTIWALASCIAAP